LVKWRTPLASWAADLSGRRAKAASMVFSARANVACGILVHSTYSLPDGFIVASESFVDVDIRRHKPAAMLSAKSRSFPVSARIRACRGQAHSMATAATRAHSRALAVASR
jgi:hypothetical protein